jgi:hypothetical protein
MRREELDKFLQIAERDLQIYKAIVPRRIVPPHGYENPKYFAASMFAYVWNAATGRHQNPAIAASTVAVSRLLEFSVPTYFVTSDFCRAVLATDPPEDYLASQIKWPMPAMLFCLPPDVIAEYTGYYVPFLAVIKAEKTQYRIKLPGLDLPSFVDNDTERLILYYTPTFGDIARGLPVDYTGAYPLAAPVSQICECSSFTDWSPEQHIQESGAPQGEKDQEFQRKMNALTIKLLLALTVRPALIGMGKLERPARIKKGAVIKDELWSPNVIGRGYRVVREQSGFKTGLSPKMHWRKGHNALQACGPRHLMVKVADLPKTEKGKIDWNLISDEQKEAFFASHQLIWVEPQLIGAEDENVVDSERKSK